MSRELKETRTNINEDLITSINEAVDYCNKYYYCFYMDIGGEEDYIEEDDIEDARILLALQDRAINLMKRATYKELESAFPLGADVFDDSAEYDCILSTTQNVLEYINYRIHYNQDLGMFFKLRTQARITLGEF